MLRSRLPHGAFTAIPALLADQRCYWHRGDRRMAQPAAASLAHAPAQGSSDLRRLALAALGVVYGDIGTSPLYTIQQTFGEAGGLSLDETNVLGALSLIFWSLVLVVTVKYVALILRADNRGEGGVLASARWPPARSATSRASSS